jgi:hypothetical protein
MRGQVRFNGIKWVQVWFYEVKGTKRRRANLAMVVKWLVKEYSSILQVCKRLLAVKGQNKYSAKSVASK